MYLEEPQGKSRTHQPPPLPPPLPASRRWSCRKTEALRPKALCVAKYIATVVIKPWVLAKRLSRVNVPAG